MKHPMHHQADPDGTDLFLSLTPEQVLEAVEASGLRCRSVCYPLNSFENRVYEVELDEPSPADQPGKYRRVIAKFYRPQRWSAEQILEEHAFLRELAEDELPVCDVLPFADGETLKRSGPILYCLFERRGGRAPDELDDRTVERLGMLVGRMHAVGARRDAPVRRALDAERYVREPTAWLRRHGPEVGLQEPMLSRYVSIALKIADIAEAEMLGTPMQRIHADLHLGNILVRDGLLRVLDFDDMAIGPPVQDLWLALPGRDAATRRQREIFLEGYEQFRIFDHTTLRLIEPLRGLRMVRYAVWLGRRWHDPAFRIGWPDFGTTEFWNQETEDLERQLAFIRGEIVAEDDEPGGAGAEAEVVEEALTNKDYFWDWEDS